MPHKTAVVCSLILAGSILISTAALITYNMLHDAHDQQMSQMWRLQEQAASDDAQMSQRWRLEQAERDDARR